MKKEYSAPEIIFDSFALNENIASVNSNCDRNITSAYSGYCGLNFGGIVLFTITAAGCKFKVQDGSPAANAMCYHIPTGGNKLFNS